eukprot:129156-Prymnesium_polylepis.6
MSLLWPPSSRRWCMDPHCSTDRSQCRRIAPSTGSNRHRPTGRCRVHPAAISPCAASAAPLWSRRVSGARQRGPRAESTEAVAAVVVLAVDEEAAVRVVERAVAAGVEVAMEVVAAVGEARAVAAIAAAKVEATVVEAA